MVATTSARAVPLGHLVMTAGVAAAVAASPAFALGITQSLCRHQRGDWGEVCAEDWRANDWSLAHGERILSAYTVAGERVWILTERDRSATTILYPGEY